KFEMTIINGEEKLTYHIIPLTPDRKRIYYRADRVLQKEKILRGYTVKGLKFGVAPVDKFLNRSMELIDADMYYGK
ncbi:MAG: hypothetical protein GY941_08810, partial [Planctomycetes bacterium]|nr:hypothetical protein [Planctomycetota bacterium]